MAGGSKRGQDLPCHLVHPLIRIRTPLLPLWAKSAEMWKDAMSDPTATARMPFKPERFAFLKEVTRLEREGQA